jgi:hypothetical protein
MLESPRKMFRFYTAVEGLKEVSHGSSEGLKFGYVGRANAELILAVAVD